MNIIYLVLTLEYLFHVEFVNSAKRMYLIPETSSHLVNGNSQSHQVVSRSFQLSQAPDHVKLRIIDANGKTLNVNLKSTQRVLANEHLPIWFADGVVNYDSLDDTDGDELQRNYEVMLRLGQFTTYQEPETLSSAVYFHHRHTFDGMIDYEYVIYDLPAERVHPTEETVVQLDQWGVYHRRGNRGHTNYEWLHDTLSGVNDQQRLKTHGGHVYDGYPEVLVIVPCDVIEQLIKDVHEFDWYTTVVSYVLTLFNGIDMLYSNLKDTKIHVNIAGIIFGTSGSFGFLENCYHTVIGTDGRPEYQLSGACVNRCFRRYLSARKEKIPVDSYDIVVFLTNEHLYNVIGEDLSETGGLILEETYGVSSVMLELYKNRKHGREIILVGSITNREHMGSYPIIAHEMAHLMTALHDEPPLFMNSDECYASLMKPGGEWCDTCMHWSQTSEKTFKLFYSSPNCCAFINKPRSLYPPRHQPVITADEQCRCYGFVSARKFWHLFNHFCSRDLQCEDVDNYFHHTVVPMDGTPCSNNKACYRKICSVI